MLNRTATLRQVLWNFSRFEDHRRITLQQNPHFYVNLPTSADEYRGSFRALPVETLHLKPDATFYVVADGPDRIFLEAGQESRIFGNVFLLEDAIIFKSTSNIPFFTQLAFDMSQDVHGVLEGESVIEESIRGMPISWHGEGPFVFPGSIPLTRAHHHDLPPIVVTDRCKCEDWRDLIRRKLSIGDNNFHIYSERSPQLSAQKQVRCDGPCLNTF